MNKPLLATAAVLAALAGCVTPDYLTYRNQPLVAQVEEGMSKQQVLGIGGQPSAMTARSLSPGSCHDYLLSQADQQQAYHVSFDSAGKVDHKGFTSCAEWESAERAASESSIFGGGGGGGY